MIDEKDKKIIDVLRQDARMSIRDIAKKINLRHSTVHQRMKKLINSKVIEKFTLKCNNKQVNENFLLNMETNRSGLEDVDLAKVISEYQRQLVALEASQKSYVQIQGMSLFDYL